MNKKKVLLPVLLLALGVGGFVILKVTRPKPPQAVVKEPVWRVQAMSAQISKLSPVTRLNGRVESPEQTKAAAPGTGRVLNVSVREGQAVQPGQRLLELDPRDFQPRVDQARGEVDELQAAIGSEQLRHQADLDQLKQERQLLDFAAADVGRFEQLRKENFYSQSAVDQSRQNLARQQITLRSRELSVADHQARLLQLQARLAKARANLEQAELAWRQGDAPRAERLARQWLADAQAIRADNPHSARVGMAAWMLSLALRAQGRTADADAQAADARRHLQATVRPGHRWRRWAEATGA